MDGRKNNGKHLKRRIPTSEEAREMQKKGAAAKRAKADMSAFFVDYGSGASDEQPDLSRLQLGCKKIVEAFADSGDIKCGEFIARMTGQFVERSQVEATVTPEIDLGEFGIYDEEK